MNGYRKFFLVEPDIYHELKKNQMTSNHGKVPDDVLLPELNAQMVTEKNLEEQTNQEMINKLEKNIKPILTSSLAPLITGTTGTTGITGTTATTGSTGTTGTTTTTGTSGTSGTSGITGTTGITTGTLDNIAPIDVTDDISPISPGTEQDPMIELIQKEVPKNYRPKITKFYSLLKEVPGIKILPSGIIVDDQYIFGNSLTTLSQLVRNNKHTSYNVKPLLQKIVAYPDIVKLILNKHANEVFQSIPMTSTPKKSNQSNDSVIFFEPDSRTDDDDGGNKALSISQDQFGSGIHKKSRKRKIVWKSLF